MKNKTTIFIFSGVIIIICLAWILINRNNIAYSINTLRIVFIVLGGLSVLLIVIDIISLNRKQTKLNNIIMIIKPYGYSKYSTLAFLSCMTALFCFYIKDSFAISLSLMLFAMSLFHFSRHISKYYISDTGIWRAGIDHLWKDVTSLKTNQKNSSFEVSFRTLSGGYSRTIQVPYSNQNKEKIEKLFTKFVQITN
jgi:hypothetical protein